MTVAYMVPNTTEANTAAIVGTGGTAHNTLATGIVGNYLLADPGEGALCGLTSPTLTAGQIVVGVQIGLEAAAHDGAEILPVAASLFDIAANPYAVGINTTARATADTYTSSFFAQAFTQYELDTLRLQVFLGVPKFGAATTARFIAALVVVTIADPPSVAVTGPTGASVSTSTPTTTWTYTAGAHGGQQSKYRVRVFTAAQYGAGGFNPATSTATWDSGVTAGAAVSRQITTPLVNATTYRAYVQVTHTINGQDASSAWAYSQFTTSFATSDISTVTAVADNATGKITVTVNRNTGTEAWDSIDLERSLDAGATWMPVRGATRQGATNTWLTTWGANSAVVVDYEAGNGVAATYRARATNDNAGADVTGAWVSSSSVSWSSSATFVKDPLNPSRNATFRLHAMPDQARVREQGMHDIIGRADPVVVVDARRTPSGRMVVHTPDLATANALDVLSEATTWLLHGPVAHRLPAYIVANSIAEIRPVRVATLAHRYWEVDYRVVAVPADDT